MYKLKNTGTLPTFRCRIQIQITLLWEFVSLHVSIQVYFLSDILTTFILRDKSSFFAFIHYQYMVGHQNLSNINIGFPLPKVCKQFFFNQPHGATIPGYFVFALAQRDRI
jgi:hypothetical protein